MQLGLDQAGKQRKFQLQELDELHLEAYENSQIYKQKFKKMKQKKVLRNTLQLVNAFPIAPLLPMVSKLTSPSCTLPLTAATLQAEKKVLVIITACVFEGVEGEIGQGHAKNISTRQEEPRPRRSCPGQTNFLLDRPALEPNNPKKRETTQSIGSPSAMPHQSDPAQLPCHSWEKLVAQGRSLEGYLIGNSLDQGGVCQELRGRRLLEETTWRSQCTLVDQILSVLAIVGEPSPSIHGDFRLRRVRLKPSQSNSVAFESALGRDHVGSVFVETGSDRLRLEVSPYVRGTRLFSARLGVRCFGLLPDHGPIRASSPFDKPSQLSLCFGLGCLVEWAGLDEEGQVCVRFDSGSKVLGFLEWLTSWPGGEALLAPQETAKRTQAQKGLRRDPLERLADSVTSKRKSTTHLTSANGTRPARMYTT
ncbi:hypothetical protein CR513_10359, partial [Mucuna pruriens]